MSNLIFNGTRICNDAALVASANRFTLDICPTTSKNQVNVVRKCVPEQYADAGGCPSDCSLMQGSTGGSLWANTTTAQKSKKSVTIDCGDAYIAIDDTSFGRSYVSDEANNQDTYCLNGASDPFFGQVETCDELDETFGWDYEKYIYEKCYGKNKCKIRRSNKMIKKAGVPKSCQPIMQVEFYCVKNDAGVSKKYVKKARKKGLAACFYKPDSDCEDLDYELVQAINPAFEDFW